MARYIIIDDFNNQYPTPVLDEDGYMKVFEDWNEAVMEARNYQNGKVLEL